MNWVSMRRIAALTRAQNLLNSRAALVGAFHILGAAPSALPVWICVVGVGGLIGAFMGSHCLLQAPSLCSPECPLATATYGR